MAAEDFDSVEANAGSGGALFAMDTFTDLSGDTRVMPLSCIVIVDGAGYSRVGAANPLPVSGTFYQATQPISAAALPLPTGAATAAKQPALGTAGVASADVITIQGVTGMDPVEVKIVSFGASVSIAGELAVHVGAEVPEDAPASSGQTGLSVLGVRKDTPASTAGTDGDWTQFTFDANGCLWINVNASALPTGAATSAKQDTGNTSLTSIDSKLATPSAITGDNVAAPTAPNSYGFGMVFDGTNWDGMPGTSANGVLVNLGSNNGVDTELPAAAALADGAANPTAPMVGADMLLFNGTTWDRARGDTTNGLDVDVTRLPALVAGSAIIGKVTTDQTTHGTTDLVAADITKVAGSAIAQGNGTAAAAIRVALPTDGTGVVILGAGSQIVGKFGIDQTTPGTTNLVQGAELLVDDAAFTPATSKVAPIGLQCDETATDSVDEGDIGCPRMTPDRKQIVTDLPHTAGGLTMSKTVSAASTNATSVKASAGQLYEIMASNVNAAARYLKLYNKASAPTVGTDTPVWTVIIPGNTAGGGVAKSIPKGLAFDTGIAFALTTEATDAGTTGVAASEIVVNLGYK